MLNAVRELAYAKVNLCLFLGAVRDDGRHELVTLFESIQGLVDELVVSPAPSGQDEVVCPGVSGPNLVGDALAALRGAGWDAPPVRVAIEKRIPVAAGMGGGSADAAAMLRCAPRLGAVSPAALATIAAGLGADVPGQLDPGPSLGTGAGEIVAALPDLCEHCLLVLPQAFGLSTAEVYRQADRLGIARPDRELASLRSELQTAVGAREHPPRTLPERLIVNDLQPAALCLAPEIAGALQLAREAGAEPALVCGSGPTVIGVFWGPAGCSRAHRAAERLRGRSPAAVVATAVGRGVLASAPND